MALKELRWSRGNTELVLDVDRQLLVPLLRGAALVRATGGSWPMSLAFDGAHVWVANYYGQLTKIDVETNAVMTSAFGVAYGCFGMAFDGEFLWLGDNGGGAIPPGIVRIDIKTNTVAGRVGVGSSPRGLAFDGRYVWVANGLSGTVSRINTATSARLDIGTGAGPKGLAFDGRYMWVTNSAGNSVTKIDPVNGSVVANISLATSHLWGGPTCAAFDGTYLWVLGDGGFLTRIDANTNTIVSTVRAGGSSFPQGIAFDGATIWVTNQIGNCVSRVNTAGAILSSVGVGPNPQAIAFDGSHLWTCGFNNDGLVTKIPVLG
jgi:YVTN family beta-propeller protein